MVVVVLLVLHDAKTRFFSMFVVVVVCRKMLMFIVVQWADVDGFCSSVCKCRWLLMFFCISPSWCCRFILSVDGICSFIG